MTETANARFSEYATSGAYTLGLSRNQVSALTMIVGESGTAYGGGPTASLERKGLAELTALAIAAIAATPAAADRGAQAFADELEELLLENWETYQFAKAQSIAATGSC